MLSKRSSNGFAVVSTTLLVINLGLLSAQQKHQPPARTPDHIDQDVVLAPSLAAPRQGTIEGYVYWDTSAAAHSPASSCAGLSVTVSQVSGGGLTPLATLSNNFKYVGRVGTFDVCAFGYGRVQVGPELHVQVSVAGGTFVPAVNAPPALQVKLINGQCANLPSAVPTAVQLEQNWWTCGNYAYNVNFAVVPANRLLGSADHGLLMRPVAGTAGLGPVAGPVQISSSGAAQSPTLLLHPGEVNPGPTQKNGPMLLLHPGEANPGPMGKTGSPVLVDPGSANAHVMLGSSAQRPEAMPSSLKPGSLPFLGTPRLVKGTQSRIAQATNQQLIVIARQRQLGGISGEQVMSANTGPAASRLVVQPKITINMTQPYTPSSLLTAAQNAECAQREAQSQPPLIYAVDNRPNGFGVVYTPDPTGNPYIIVGCGFGTGGTAALMLVDEMGEIQKSLNLQILSWSDHALRASLDPNATQLPDWQSAQIYVTVQSNGARARSKSGTFYAERATIELPSIAKPQAVLYQQGAPYFLSPVADYYGMDGTVAVMRQGLPANALAGQDKYTMNLAQGFAVDSTETDLLVSSANANVTSKPPDINGNTITVTYPILSSGSGDATNFYSIYGLKIWVTGPRGIDPVTGKPAQ